MLRHFRALDRQLQIRHPRLRSRTERVFLSAAEKGTNLAPDLGASGKPAPVRADQPDQFVALIDRHQVILRRRRASDMPDAVHQQSGHVVLHLSQDRIHSPRCPSTYPARAAIPWGPRGWDTMRSLFCCGELRKKNAISIGTISPSHWASRHLKIPQEQHAARHAFVFRTALAFEQESRKHRKRRPACASPVPPGVRVPAAVPGCTSRSVPPTARLRANCRSAANAFSCEGGIAGAISIPSAARKVRPKAQSSTARSAVAPPKQTRQPAAAGSSTTIGCGIRRGILYRCLQRGSHRRGRRAAAAGTLL